MARAARAARLVIYAGAGLSVAAPACGPKGAEVTERLRPFVAEILGVPVSEIVEQDLESLAGRIEVEKPHRLTDLKVRAANHPAFLDMVPNYGHLAFALLIREGAAKGVTVNWDRGIENAGLRLEVEIEGVASALDRQRLGRQLPLYKVHGCAKRPETVDITRAEVDKPQNWARAEVAQALAGDMVVFVGLGTVGLYVSEPIAELPAIWATEGVSIRVVDPYGLSEAWNAALVQHANDSEITMGSDEFLDELLRAIVIEALSITQSKIQDIDDGSPWVSKMRDGYQALRAALGDKSADAVLRWWRDGVSSSEHGRPFILDHPGRQSLMAVSLLAGLDGGPLVISGASDQLTVRSARRYFEIVCRPEERFADIDRAARERIARRRERGIYEPGVPVDVAVHGGAGTFPHQRAHADISAEDGHPGELGTETGSEVRLIRAELAVTGELAA